MYFTRRSWYILAVMIPIVAWIIATSQLAKQWDNVHAAKPVTLDSKFDAAGQSVAVFTDFEQPGRAITCSVTKPKDHAVALTAPPLQISVDYDSARWHLIGMLEEGMDDMSIACIPDDQQIDSATYAYALVSPVAVDKAVANFIMWGGIAFGLLVSIVIGYNRRSFTFKEM